MWLLRNHCVRPVMWIISRANAVRPYKGQVQWRRPPSLSAAADISPSGERRRNVLKAYCSKNSSLLSGEKKKVKGHLTQVAVL